MNRRLIASNRLRREAAVQGVTEASLPHLHPDHELALGVVSLEDVLAAYRNGAAGGRP